MRRLREKLCRGSKRSFGGSRGDVYADTLQWLRFNYRRRFGSAGPPQVIPRSIECSYRNFSKTTSLHFPSSSIFSKSCTGKVVREPI